MTGFSDPIAGKAGVYRFGDFVVDPAAFRLSRNGEPIRIEPKALEILIYLVAHRDRVVGKDELLDAVWKGTFVTPNALTRAIAHLRKTLGDDAEAPQYIETVPTRGYRFIGKEETAVAPASAVSRAPAGPPYTAPTASCLPVASLIAASAAIALILLTLAIVRREHVKQSTIKPPKKGSVQLAAGPLVRGDGLHLFPAFSPDGTRVAYTAEVAGKPQIFITSLSGEKRQLTREADGAIQPCWSPDGRSVAYVSPKRGGISIVRIGRGTARRLTESGFRPAWGPDGEIVFQTADQSEIAGMAFDAQPPSTLAIVYVRTGRVQALTRPGAPAGGHGAPSWRADGERIAFSSCDIEYCAIHTIARDGGSLTTVAHDTITLSSPVFARNGQSLYFLVNRYIGGALVVQQIGPGGEPASRRELVRGSRPNGMQHLTATPAGPRFAWSLIAQTSNLVSLDLDESGAPKGDPKQLTNNTRTRASFPTFSPDGSKIAWCAIGADDESGIWVADREGTNPRPVNAGPQLKQHAQWGRVESEIFYSAWEDGPSLVATSLINGQSSRVGNLPRDASSVRISPDRSTIAFNRSRAGKVSVWSVRVDGGDLRRLTADADLARNPIWSPSGRQIAVQVRQPDGSSGIGVIPAGGGPVRVVTSGGEARPYGWSPDEQFIAFAALRDGHWNIWSVEVATGRSRRLTNNTSMAVWMRFPAWSPDGRRIMFESGTTSGEIWVSNPAAVQ